ncbi:MAG TPA: hypothetical protein V6C72_19935, partial [Chroococcales cyanobacterium]
MKLSLKISQKVLLLVSIPLLLNLLLIGALGMLVAQAEQESIKADESREIVFHLNRVLTSLLMGEGGMTLGTLRTKNGIKTMHTTQLFRAEIDQLKPLMARRPEELQALLAVVRGFDAADAKLDQLKRELFETGDVGVVAYLAEAKRSLQGIIAEMDRLAECERKIEEDYPKSQAERVRSIRMLLLTGAALNVMFALGCTFLFNRSTGNRLKVLMDNSVRLSVGEPLLPAVPGDDEIARLDSSFHSMASTLLESARKERAVIDNALDIICTIDRDERVKAINPASLATWGYPPEELQGRRYS